MTEKQNRGAGTGRGKQKRQPHWIYEVEKALDLDHSNIAQLLTPEPLTIRAVWDICQSHSHTTALNGLEFPVAQSTVSDIITGESRSWAEKAATLLYQRLGVVSQEFAETGKIHAFDNGTFSKDSLRRYLTYATKMMKNPELTKLSGFAQAGTPQKLPRRRPKYTIESPRLRRKRDAPGEA